MFVHYIKQTNSIFYWNFTSFSTNAFFCSRIKSGIQQFILLSCLLKILWSVTFLGFCFVLFLMILTVLRSIGQVFCRMFFNLDFLMFFSLLVWGYGFWRRITQRWSAFLFHRISENISTLVTTDDVNCGHLVKIWFARCLICKVNFHPLPHLLI